MSVRVEGFLNAWQRRLLVFLSRAHHIPLQCKYNLLCGGSPSVAWSEWSSHYLIPYRLLIVRYRQHWSCCHYSLIPITCTDCHYSTVCYLIVCTCTACKAPHRIRITGRVFTIAWRSRGCSISEPEVIFNTIFQFDLNIRQVRHAHQLCCTMLSLELRRPFRRHLRASHRA